MIQLFALVQFTTVFFLISLTGTEWRVALPIETDNLFFQGQYNTRVSALYDPRRHILIAAWAGNNLFPYYAIFDGNQWFSKGLMNSSSCVFSNVFLCREPNLDQIIAIWIDTSLNYYPQYAIYNGDNWISKGIVSNFGSSGHNISACFDKNLNQLLATWVDSTFVLRYATYNGIEWVDRNTINSIHIDFDINCCYSDKLSLTIATWRYENVPYYSIFNGKTWLDGAPITLIQTTSFNISCLADNDSGLVFAFFADNENYPCFSTFDGSTWSIPQKITINSKVARDLSCASNLNTNQLFCTWTDLYTNSPFSGICEENGIDSSVPISSESFVIMPHYETSVIFNPTGTLFASWIDRSGFPFFSIYGIGLNPPGSLSGFQSKNDFKLFYEHANIINWTLSDSENITGYEIHRQNTFIGIVDGRTSVYVDHNQPKNKPLIYQVYALNTFGGRSLAKTIVIE